MEVIVYIGGKRVPKEKLSQYEIKSERIKQIVLQALRRKKETGRQD